MSRSKPKKATNMVMTLEYLQSRASEALSRGFAKARWIEFCEEMIAAGFKVSLYEARQTVSKYVTVYGNERRFKVRFSNHRPIRHREIEGDCDFFVGRTHLGCTNTAQAIAATLAHLNEKSS